MPSADHTDAYFALAGALGAAIVVSAVNLFAQWRQRKADRDALRLQLDAERERLDRQLQHDRALVDLAELRELLDRGVERAGETDDKLSDCWVSAEKWVEADTSAARARARFDEAEGDEPDLTGRAASWTHAQDAADQRLKTLEQHRSAAYRVVWPFEELLARLAVRLGRDHLLVAALAAYRDAASSSLSALPKEPSESREQVKERGLTHARQMRQARTRYVDLATEIAGAQPEG